MSVTYEIILKSQLGPKNGSFRIRKSGERLTGILNLLEHKSLLAGSSLEKDGTFELRGRMWTPLGKADCMLVGVLGERMIRGTLNVNGYPYELSGREQVSILKQKRS